MSEHHVAACPRTSASGSAAGLDRGERLRLLAANNTQAPQGMKPGQAILALLRHFGQRLYRSLALGGQGELRLQAHLLMGMTQQLDQFLNGALVEAPGQQFLDLGDGRLLRRLPDR